MSSLVSHTHETSQSRINEVFSITHSKVDWHASTISDYDRQKVSTNKMLFIAHTSLVIGKITRTFVESIDFRVYYSLSLAAAVNFLRSNQTDLLI